MVCVWRSSPDGLSARLLRSWVCRLKTLRKRVRQAEADQGLRPDLPSSEEREQIRQLKRENAELRKANEILRAASLFFASELDGSRTK